MPVDDKKVRAERLLISVALRLRRLEKASLYHTAAYESVRKDYDAAVDALETLDSHDICSRGDWIPGAVVLTKDRISIAQQEVAAEARKSLNGEVNGLAPALEKLDEEEAVQRKMEGTD